MGEFIKYHEVLPTIKDLVQGWGSRVLDLIVPDEAVEMGGGPYLDKKLNPGEVGSAPTQPSLFED